MDPQELVKVLSGDLTWMFIAALGAFMFKDMVGRFAQGLFTFLGKDYNEDDIVYINGNKKARIVRVGILSTTFFLTESGRKLVVSNNRLPSMHLEKYLPTNGDKLVKKE